MSPTAQIVCSIQSPAAVVHNHPPHSSSHLPHLYMFNPASACADMFLLFYIKRRIEQDGHLKWYEAPYCCEENPPEQWLHIEQAARIFEADNKQQIEDTMIKRLEPIGKLNFQSFRKIVRHYLDQPNIEKSVALLALLAFTGMYARRLAELDFEQATIAAARYDGADDDDDEVEDEEEVADESSEEECEVEQRNYRREIYQISIYSSRILLAQLDGKWDKFYADIARMLEQIQREEQQQEQEDVKEEEVGKKEEETHKECRTSHDSTQSGEHGSSSSHHRRRRSSLVQLASVGYPLGSMMFGGFPIVATLCGVGAAVYFLFRRCGGQQ